MDVQQSVSMKIPESVNSAISSSLANYKGNLYSVAATLASPPACAVV